MNVRFDFNVMSDKELMEWFHFAQEYRDKKYLTKLREELKKRWYYA